MIYCLAVTVLSADSRQNFSNLLSDLQGYFIGRDLDPATNDFTRYVLGLSGTPVTVANSAGVPEEVSLQAIVAFNNDVTTPVKNELTQLSRRAGFVRQFEISPPKTRLEAETHVKILAAGACDKLWLTRPGDNVTVADSAALLAKFASPVA